MYSNLQVHIFSTKHTLCSRRNSDENAMVCRNECNYYRLVLTTICCCYFMNFAFANILTFQPLFSSTAAAFFLRTSNKWLFHHQNSFSTYHYVSWFQVLCFPLCVFQSPDSPVGSVCHCGELVNWKAIHDGNSVPALPVASVELCLS